MPTATLRKPTKSALPAALAKRATGAATVKITDLLCEAREQLSLIARRKSFAERIAEDAAAGNVAMKMRYFTASRRDESWRHVSVHRVDHGTRPQLIGTCHKANALRRFRVSSVLEARLDPVEQHRPVDVSALRLFDEESFGGFRHDGPSVPCVFFVRDAQAAWVSRNLPDDRITQEATAGGARFRVTTSAVEFLARFVVGLGDAATAETVELREAIARIARGAPGNAALAPVPAS